MVCIKNKINHHFKNRDYFLLKNALIFTDIPEFIVPSINSSRFVPISQIP